MTFLVSVTPVEKSVTDSYSGPSSNVITSPFGPFHVAGDALLIAVAERLQTVVRRTDLIGRFGWDESGLCLREPAPDDAEATVQRIMTAFSKSFPLAGGCSGS